MSPVGYPVRADQDPLPTCIARNGDFLGGGAKKNRKAGAGRMERAGGRVT